MHYAVNIIFIIEMCKKICIILIEIQQFHEANVLPSDAHKSIAFERVLHMKESESVKQFVDNDPLAQTTVDLQIDWLSTAISTNQ